ncbi:hypothetical protein, partial [Escherichia coli]|uniref:hypothetical protein n=1 Tax=Escherichia coli TaxID=562 RepID=UPI001AD93076
LQVAAKYFESYAKGNCINIKFDVIAGAKGFQVVTLLFFDTLGGHGPYRHQGQIVMGLFLKSPSE